MFGKTQSSNARFVMAMGRKAGNVKKIMPDKAPARARAVAPKTMVKKTAPGAAVARKMAHAGAPASKSIKPDAPMGHGKASDRKRHMSNKVPVPKVQAAQGVERSFSPVTAAFPTPGRLSKGKVNA